MQDLARLHKSHDNDEIPPTSLKDNLPTTGTTYNLYHFFFKRNQFFSSSRWLSWSSGWPSTHGKDISYLLSLLSVNVLLKWFTASSPMILLTWPQQDLIPNRLAAGISDFSKQVILDRNPDNRLTLTHYSPS